MTAAMEMPSVLDGKTALLGAWSGLRAGLESYMALTSFL